MNIKLVSYTPNPLGTVAWMKGLIFGKHRDPNSFSREEQIDEFVDCTRTALTTPFEAVHFCFDFIDVTRAFTHQLVRTRHASYMQESLRFSAKCGEQFKYLTPETIQKNREALVEYRNTMSEIQLAYENLIEMGVPTEDARGVLPTNIQTSIVQVIDYRNLIHMAESRLCFQTQGEHRLALIKMKQLIAEVEPIMAEYLQPSCFHNGFCDWQGSADRPCVLHKEFAFKSEVVKYHKEIKELIASKK
jgi:thymidylate synthase (FAD)